MSSRRPVFIIPEYIVIDDTFEGLGLSDDELKELGAEPVHESQGSRMMDSGDFDDDFSDDDFSDDEYPDTDYDDDFSDDDDFEDENLDGLNDDDFF